MNASQNNNRNNNPNNNNNNNLKRLQYNEMMRNNRIKMREQERKVAESRNTLERTYVDLKRQIRQLQAMQRDAYRAGNLRGPNVRHLYMFNILTMSN